MTDNPMETCDTCACFDQELKHCAELERVNGPGVRTTWQPQETYLVGPVGREVVGESRTPPESEDGCHFSDGSRWRPRQAGQGPDGM